MLDIFSATTPPNLSRLGIGTELCCSDYPVAWSESRSWQKMTDNIIQYIKGWLKAHIPTAKHTMLKNCIIKLIHVRYWSLESTNPNLRLTFDMCKCVCRQCRYVEKLSQSSSPSPSVGSLWLSSNQKTAMPSQLMSVIQPWRHWHTGTIDYAQQCERKAQTGISGRAGAHCNARQSVFTVASTSLR